MSEKKDGDLVFVDFGKIELDKKYIKFDKDNFDKFVNIPKETAEKIVKECKEQAKKNKLSEKRKALLKLYQNKDENDNLETNMFEEEEDECFFDIYEEEDDF